MNRKKEEGKEEVFRPLNSFLRQDTIEAVDMSHALTRQHHLFILSIPFIRASGSVYGTAASGGGQALLP